MKKRLGLLILGVVALLVLVPAGIAWRNRDLDERLEACLPDWVQMESTIDGELVVDAGLVRRLLASVGRSPVPVRWPTVCDELHRLGARPRDNKLWTTSGKEIRFVRGGGISSFAPAGEAAEREVWINVLVSREMPW